MKKIIRLTPKVVVRRRRNKVIVQNLLGGLVMVAIMASCGGLFVYQLLNKI